MASENSSGGWAEARQVLEGGAAAHVYPAAVAEVGGASGVRWRHAVGRLTYDDDSPMATASTIFDLASLTKVIVTTTMAMRLVERGVIDLDASIAGHHREWEVDARPAPVSVRDLLEHSSGLPAWAPLYRTASNRAEYAAAIGATPLEYPPRSRSVYSDLGFMLLGLILEARAQAHLDEQFRALVREIGDAEWQDLAFVPPLGWRERTAPTRFDTCRDRLLIGEVDDANAAALGGVAAHSGLFGTAGAVGAFARRLLADCCRGTSAPGSLARPETIGLFLTRSRVPGSSRALGWDTMLPTSSCGTRMSGLAFGHTGFTGTSLWIDPARDLYAVLLTNRVYPDGGPAEAIQGIRRAFHDAVLTEPPRG